MKISMAVITHFLYIQAGVKTTLYLKGPKAHLSPMSIEGVLFWESGVSIRQNCLYVCFPRDLAAAPLFPPDTNILCIGSVPESVCEALDQVNMILAGGTVSQQSLFNDILKCFSYYNLWADRLSSASGKGASIHKLLELGTEAMGEPMCLLDANHNVISITTNLVSVNDPLWDILEAGYGYRYQEIISKSTPKLRDIKRKRQPVECINNISGYYLYCSPVFVDNSIEAFLGIHKSQNRTEPFEPWFKLLCGFFVGVLGAYFKNNGSRRDGVNSQADRLFLDMLEGRMFKRNEIVKYIRKYHLAFSNHLQILMFAFRGQIDQTDFYMDIIGQIRGILPEAHYIIQNCTIMAVVDLKRESYISPRTVGALQDILTVNRGYCSVSLMFNSIEELIPAYRQAQAALSIGLALDAKSSFYHYHEYLGLHGLKLLYQELATAHYLHPMLVELKDYDEKYNTDYYVTLQVYLRNNCSLSQSSECIKMHRNSFLYRINKIKELLGTNFEDSSLRMELLFSYYAAEYLNLFDKDLTLETLLG